MTGWTARRFWTEAVPRQTEGGWSVALDDRPLRTPAKAPLLLPSRVLAAMIAAEWQAQGETVDPTAMPATRMANSAIDKVAPQHAEVAALVAAYGGSDLLCYRAPYPAELVARQRHWDAPLGWAERALGARLQPTVGVMPRAQDPAALARLAERVDALPAFELAPFHDLVAITGSLILGLAVAEQAMDAAEAWALSRIDEEFQIERWGSDEEAAESAERRRQDLVFAETFLIAARDRSGNADGLPARP
jgi:chaperone required for assembly of F1-ATPase